jgi:hypothetical protein
MERQLQDESARNMRRGAVSEESAARAKKAMQEYMTKNAAVTVKTAQLRALRLAKEAEAGQNGKIKIRRKKAHPSARGRLRPTS